MAYNISVTEVTSVVTATTTENNITVNVEDQFFDIAETTLAFTATEIVNYFTFSENGIQVIVDDFANYFMGDWISGTTYRRGQIVNDNYSLFVCSTGTSTTLTSTVNPSDVNNSSLWRRVVWNEAPRSHLTVTNYFNVGTTATISGNTNIGGNLSVTGTTNLSGLLTLGTALNQLTVTNHLSAGSLSVGGVNGSGLTINGVATFNSGTVFNDTSTFNRPSTFTSISVNTLTSNLIVATNVTATTLTANTIRFVDGTSFTSTNAIQVTWDNVIHKDDNQGPDRVTLGLEAGRNPDPEDPNEPSVVAIGNFAGRRLQKVGAIAIGKEAGVDDQMALSIAIGLNAGRYRQGKDPGSLARGTGESIAIGASAGSVDQERWAVALGRYAGYQNQGEKSIAIGTEAGYYANGTSTVAIGYKANGINANQIVLNASGDYFGGAFANALYIKPIRSDDSTTTNILCYNNGSGEVVQATRQSLLGNIDYGPI